MRKSCSITKVNQQLDENKISFRNLQLTDLSLLYKWLNEPFVKEWYGRNDPSDLESITKKYTPRIEGKNPTSSFIVCYEEIPVGYIQTYKINDYPDFAKHLKMDVTGFACVDLFIGNAKFMGKGLGSLMLKKFLKDIVFTQEGIIVCLIDPEPVNIRAIRSYEKAGFKYLKTIQVPDEKKPKYLMIIKKQNFNST